MTKSPPIKITPEMVIQARHAANAPRKMSMTIAGSKIYVSGRMWSRYETGASEMHPGHYELFLIKTGQVMAQVAALTLPRKEGNDERKND